MIRPGYYVNAYEPDEHGDAVTLRIFDKEGDARAFLQTCQNLGVICGLTILQYGPGLPQGIREVADVRPEKA